MPADVRDMLRAVGWRDAVDARRVEGGFDTEIWRVQGRRRPVALRVMRPAEAVRARREALVMGAARAAGLPVPAVLGLGDWNGRPVLLLEWCAGESVDQALLRRPRQAVRLGRRFGGLQALMHAVAPPPELPRLATAAGRPERLLHGDFHPRNVLVDGDRVTAVIDWTNAVAGDPRADVACTAAKLRLEAPARGLVPPERRRAWRGFAAAWRAGYRAVAGEAALDGLAPFYAAEGRRLGDLDGRYGRLARAWAARWEAWARRSAPGPSP